MSAAIATSVLCIVTFALGWLAGRDASRRSMAPRNLTAIPRAARLIGASMRRTMDRT